MWFVQDHASAHSTIPDQSFAKTVQHDAKFPARATPCHTMDYPYCPVYLLCCSTRPHRLTDTTWTLCGALNESNLRGWEEGYTLGLRRQSKNKEDFVSPHWVKSETYKCQARLLKKAVNSFPSGTTVYIYITFTLFIQLTLLAEQSYSWDTMQAQSGAVEG